MNRAAYQEAAASAPAIQRGVEEIISRLAMVDSAILSPWLVEEIGVVLWGALVFWRRGTFRAEYDWLLEPHFCAAGVAYATHFDRRAFDLNRRRA
jgi:hypothetical protein